MTDGPCRALIQVNGESVSRTAVAGAAIALRGGRRERPNSAEKLRSKQTGHGSRRKFETGDPRCSSACSSGFLSLSSAVSASIGANNSWPWGNW